MAEIILPGRWVAQPQFPASVATNNPLARGLRFVTWGKSGYIWTNVPNVTIAKNNYGATIRTVQYRSRSATSPDFATNVDIRINAAVTGTNPAGVTYFGLVQTDQTSAGEATIVGQSNNATVTQLFRLMYLPFSGYTLQTRDDSNTTVNCIANVQNTLPHFIVGVFRTGTGQKELWSDGIRMQTSVSNVGTLTINQTEIGSLVSTGAGQHFWDGAIALAGVYDRALSGPEIYELSQNPWQLFQAHARRTYSFTSDTGLSETLGSVGATAGVSSLTAEVTGDALSETLTGVGSTAGVSSLTADVTGDALSETLTGVGASSGVTDLTAVSTDVLSETLTGVGATAGVNDITANADTADTVTLSGVGATSGVGELTVVFSTILTETLTGVGASSGVTDLGASMADDETLTGVGASAGVSDLSVTVTEEGAELLGSVGATTGVSSLTVDLQQDAEVTLTGVGATAGVNDLIIPREEPLLDEEIAAALGPIVKGSVFPLRRPQRETAEIARAHLPEIVYTIVSDDWEQAETLCGVGLHATRVQIDVYANHYKEARGYAYAVAKEMDALGWRINMQPFPDDDEKIYRWQLEYSCWRNEAPPDIPVSRTNRRR